MKICQLISYHFTNFSISKARKNIQSCQYSRIVVPKTRKRKVSADFGLWKGKVGSWCMLLEHLATRLTHFTAWNSDGCVAELEWPRRNGGFKCGE